jgi:hypothetical protein
VLDLAQEFGPRTWRAFLYSFHNAENGQSLPGSCLFFKQKSSFFQGIRIELSAIKSIAGKTCRARLEGRFRRILGAFAMLLIALFGRLWV